ncbi:hypothetical protein [Paenibacillus odorifer]|nr:hypothetical protein [Paenibacillus odorifer]
MVKEKKPEITPMFIAGISTILFAKTGNLIFLLFVITSITELVVLEKMK